ncbi:MAG: hypothetical protein IKQ24_06000 [Verrucomicrobia bacterium]|nr:hypothetical protein [Verrucomicrobiota bacterium]
MNTTSNPAVKKTGFKVTLAAVLLAVVTSLVYMVIWGKTRYYSDLSFYIMLAGAVITLICIVLRQYKTAPVIIFAFSFISFLFFVYGIYFFISSVATGIQFSGFPPEFFVTVVLFVVTFVLGLVAVFMPQTEE